ncbi:MAG: AbrB/MazE/SpoVT family DNA-binding domain-containing protein [Caulobacterales bacterium]|jgi:AbrB family looped-hinge helix DNA binding protein
MSIAHSKLTAQGQISVPAEIRRKLGIGPGSVIEWEEKGEEVVVRRAGRFSSQDVHEALFQDETPRTKTLPDLKQGIRDHMRKKHARD